MVGQLTPVPRVREIWSSSPTPTKFYTVLQTVRRRFTSMKAAAACCFGAMTRRWAPQTRYMLYSYYHKKFGII